jgi:hypothetical protein
LIERGGPVTGESSRLRRWIESGTRAVLRERDRLDAINVFPVADSDTGTNLYLTLAEGNRAIAHLPMDASHREVVAAFARGCLMGARGNSGVIVSQYLSAFLAEVDARGGLDHVKGAGIADALDFAADAAYDAVGEPVEGTILSVARAAARGGRGALEVGGDVASVAVAAVVEARVELGRTTSVLAEAREAGVVDAGAAGLVLQLEMLAETIAGPGALAALDEVEWEVRTRTEGRTPAEAADHAHGTASSARLGAYEVMFVAHRKRVAVDVVADETVAQSPPSLKSLLREIGESVAVTGDDGVWHAHVHTDHPERAIEVARAADASHVVVRHIPTAAHRARMRTGIVALTTCPGLAAALAGSAGAVLVALNPDGVAEDELARAVRDASTGRVIVVAGAPALQAAAHALARHGSEAEIIVVESASEPQVIAALTAAALVEPGDDPLPAMERAVAATTVGRAMLDSVAEDLERMVAPGVEVAMVILGAGVPTSIADAAVRRLATNSPDVEVHVYSGGQTVPSIILGVETSSDA